MEGKVFLDVEELPPPPPVRQQVCPPHSESFLPSDFWNQCTRSRPPLCDPGGTLEHAAPPGGVQAGLSGVTEPAHECVCTHACAQPHTHTPTGSVVARGAYCELIRQGLAVRTHEGRAGHIPLLHLMGGRLPTFRGKGQKS